MSQDDVETALVRQGKLNLELRAEVESWKRLALQMRDLAINWDATGQSACDEIQRLYFDAALLERFPAFEQLPNKD